MKKLNLLAFLVLLVFASGCGKTGDETAQNKETTQSKNESTSNQQVKDESKQTDNNQTKEKTTMNNSGEFKTVEIKTKGMFCSHCENTVKASINKLDGIKEVIADAKTNTAKVTFDESRTNIKAIENAITDAGYGVAEPVQ